MIYNIFTNHMIFNLFTNFSKSERNQFSRSSICCKSSVSSAALLSFESLNLYPVLSLQSSSLSFILPSHHPVYKVKHLKASPLMRGSLFADGASGGAAGPGAATAATARQDIRVG